MNFEILYDSSFPMVQVKLNSNEAFKAESTSFMGMSGGIQVKTRMQSGQIKPYMQKVNADVFYVNTYYATEQGGQVLLAPRFPGRIFPHTLTQNVLLIQPDAFLAAEEDIKVNTVWKGSGPLRTGEGLRLLRCSGVGRLLLSSYGALHQVVLKDGESITIDSGHLVALDESLQPRICQLGGLQTPLMPTTCPGRGEIVVDFRGEGRVFLQSRSQEVLLDWLRKRLGSLV